MGAQFTIPLVTVISGQLIASSLWNNEWNNINTNFIPAGMDSYSDTDAQMQIQTNPYPGSVTSHASNLGGEIERIRFMLSSIFGSTYWYQGYSGANLPSLTNVAIPVGGMIIFIAGTGFTSSFAICNGQAISRTTYATLFGIIGTAYGAGDGTTTFNIPNFQDRFLIGAGGSISPSIGNTGGASSQTLTVDQLPASIPVAITDPGHNHTQNAHTHTDSGHTHTQTGVEGESTDSPSIHRTVSVACDPGSGTEYTSTNSTNSGTANIQNTTATNQSNTTGITAVVNGGASSIVPTLPPYMGMTFLIRII